ncbi:Uncharacterised protein [Paucimonas lemoignei]|nr:Uncharacterised protein [Paucimonas lemoignei]
MALITVLYEDAGGPGSTQMEDFEFASLNIGDILMFPPLERDRMLINKSVRRRLNGAIVTVEYFIEFRYLHQ